MLTDKAENRPHDLTVTGPMLCLLVHLVALLMALLLLLLLDWSFTRRQLFFVHLLLSQLVLELNQLHKFVSSS